MSEIIEYELGDKKFVGFTRVPYGKKGTPEELKEYYLENVPASPAGTRKEIKKFIQDKLKRFDGVVLNDATNGIISHEFVLTENL